MGILAYIGGTLPDGLATASMPLVLAASAAILLLVAITVNVLQQLFFSDPTEPPVVFHWLPFIGSTIPYGIDPFKFFFDCRKKYGDVFTFIMLGRKMTVYVGTKGNEFILNGKLKDVNAEEIYSPLTTPVFGKDVVYDCPNAKLMEQKKFVKFGLTTEALRSYVTLISAEVRNYVAQSQAFAGEAKGTVDTVTMMSQLTIFTASRSLQGREVREKFDNSFADLFHDLDMGFSPINFLLPWAPLPHNRKRDAANKKITDTYTSIIQARREAKTDSTEHEQDMIWNLMASKYKDGTPVPDAEVAHMMIALLMGGQHSSASTSAWILLRLATRPEITEELLQEQKDVLGPHLPPLTYDDLQRLPLHNQVIKETLRLHTPIHSILRKVKSAMPVEGTQYVIPAGRIVVASPGVTSRMDEYFPDPMKWEPHRWDAGSGGANIQTAEEEEKFDYGYGLITKGANSPYLPFGAGRHRCIGEQFAYLQIGTILATLVRTFKFRNPEGRKGLVATDYSSLFSRPLPPAIVEWERRDSAEKA